MVKNVTFLINKSEIAAGTRGASLGPEAIMTVARKNGSLLFGENSIQNLETVNHLLDKPTRFQYAKRIDGMIHIYEKLNSQVAEILSHGDFPLLLSADHGSAGGTIAGIKSAFPSKRLGVVWIDAHADIHTPFTTPSGNIHGMPLATALSIDNLECCKNEPDEETISFWKQLKSVGGIAPKINAEDIVYVAVRDIEAEEIDIMTRLGIKNISVADVRSNDAGSIIGTINEKLAQCDIIYVSFDVDSMDPDLTSHGTGTPVKDGLTPEEAKKLVAGMLHNPKTICLEFVEVNPCLDEKVNKMAETALDIIESAVSIIKK